MSCLAEDRFIELLDQGGLEATKPGERAHLESCEACRDSWAGVAAAAEVLADARPRSSGRSARWVPLGAAAAMLLVVLGVIAILAVVGNFFPLGKMRETLKTEATEHAAKAETLKQLASKPREGHQRNGR